MGYLDGTSNAIHEATFQSPVPVMGFVKKLEIARRKAGNSNSIAPKQSKLIWIPHPGNFMKMNVEVAVAKGSDKGAVSVICRDQQGVYLGSFALLS